MSRSHGRPSAQACQNCRIDAIAIHSYWCTLDGLKNLVNSYRHFGKKCLGG